MNSITIVTVFFVVYLVALKRKRGGWLYPSIFLVAIYMLSIICLIIDMASGHSHAVLNVRYLLPALFFVFLCVLYFVPFTSFREDKVEEIVLPSKKVMDNISVVLIILSFESIIFFAGSVRDVFSYGDLGAARDDRYIYGTSFVEHSIWYTVSSVSASLYMFDILFYFIYRIIGGKNGVRRVLLFVGSFSETLHVLSEAGRDGIVFWLFAFVFIYLIFRPFLEKKQRSSIAKSFVIIAFVIMIPFTMISKGRFQDNTNDSYINYMGQPFKHFCYYFDFSPLPVSYGQSFPLFFEVLHMPQPQYCVYKNELTDSTAFGTFLRGFLTNFGIVGTLLVGVIMAFLFRVTMRSNGKTLFFNQFFMYILYFQIYSQGVFYFRQYTRGGNLFIVLCLLFTLLFKLNFSSDTIPVVIKRKVE